MTLQAFASSIAAAPAGQQNRDLSLRPPLNAVIECAHRAGAIDEDEYSALLHMDADEDFSLFVGPNDPRLRSRAEVENIPAGAFLAVVFVDRPRSYKEFGRRHLVLPMISLGDGRAAGLDPSQIGIGAPPDRWTVVDLDALNWLNANQINGYDLFNRFVVPINKHQALRIRYRLPGRSSPSTAGPGSSRLAWGRPTPSAALRQEVLAAVQAISSLKLEEGEKNPKKPPAEHVFRVNFKFELDHDAFEEFFNGPNGLRGHYYADGASGDAYTRDLLEGIADAIDWDKALATLGQDRIFGQPFAHGQKTTNKRIVALIKASLAAGKIWFNETQSVSDSADWRDGNNERVPINFAPNTRWIGTPASLLGNWRALLADTRADKGVIAQDEYSALQQKFTGDLGLAHAKTGAKYRYCRSPADAAKHGLTLVNMDVKGDWVRADGTPAGFTPAGKHFRGHQIKWFGFT